MALLQRAPAIVKSLSKPEKVERESPLIGGVLSLDKVNELNKKDRVL